MAWVGQSRLRGLPAVVLITAVMTAAPATRAASFSNATGASGIDYENVCGEKIGEKGWLSESLGSGAAWLDYDGDGNLDVYLVNGSTYERKPGTGEPNLLYRGDGRGRFEAVDGAGANDRGWGYGATVGDIDNDGDPDIYVTNFGPNVLYRNNGDGTFSDVTATAGVGNELLSTSAAFFDVEGDGDLDIYVANYMESDPKQCPSAGFRPRRSSAHCHYKGIAVLLRSTEAGSPCRTCSTATTATAVSRTSTRAAGVFLEKPRFALGVVAADYDNDGDTDIYVANDSVRNSLWRNNGDGTFADVGVGTLAALNADGQTQAGMGTDFGDYTGDGWLDLVVTNFAHDLNTVYRNAGGQVLHRRFDTGGARRDPSGAFMGRRILRLRQSTAISTCSSPTATSIRKSTTTIWERAFDRSTICSSTRKDASPSLPQVPAPGSQSNARIAVPPSPTTTTTATSTCT